jgi:hypothetical protein
LPRINHLHQWLDIYWHFRRKVERWQKRCTKNPGRQLMVIDGSQRRNSRDGIKVSKKKKEFLQSHLGYHSKQMSLCLQRNSAYG